MKIILIAIIIIFAAALIGIVSRWRPERRGKISSSPPPHTSIDDVITAETSFDVTARGKIVMSATPQLTLVAPEGVSIKEIEDIWLEIMRKGDRNKLYVRAASPEHPTSIASDGSVVKKLSDDLTEVTVFSATRLRSMYHTNRENLIVLIGGNDPPLPDTIEELTALLNAEAERLKVFWYIKDSDWTGTRPDFMAIATKGKVLNIYIEDGAGKYWSVHNCKTQIECAKGLLWALREPPNAEPQHRETYNSTVRPTLEGGPVIKDLNVPKVTIAMRFVDTNGFPREFRTFAWRLRTQHEIIKTQQEITDANGILTITLDANVDPLSYYSLMLLWANGESGDIIGTFRFPRGTEGVLDTSVVESYRVRDCSQPSIRGQKYLDIPCIPGTEQKGNQ